MSILENIYFLNKIDEPICTMDAPIYTALVIGDLEEKVLYHHREHLFRHCKKLHGP